MSPCVAFGVVSLKVLRTQSWILGYMVIKILSKYIKWIFQCTLFDCMEKEHQNIPGLNKSIYIVAVFKSHIICRSILYVFCSDSFAFFWYQTSTQWAYLAFCKLWHERFNLCVCFIIEPQIYQESPQISSLPFGKPPPGGQGKVSAIQTSTHAGTACSAHPWFIGIKTFGSTKLQSDWWELYFWNKTQSLVLTPTGSNLHKALSSLEQYFLCCLPV